MGDPNIRAVFQWWNKKLNLNPGKRLIAASARRTFCTVGDKYTARVCIFDVTFDVTWVWCSSKFRGRASWRSLTTSARSSSGSALRKVSEYIVETNWEDPRTACNSCPQNATHTSLGPSTSGPTAADTDLLAPHSTRCHVRSGHDDEVQHRRGSDLGTTVVEPAATHASRAAHPLRASVGGGDPTEAFLSWIRS